MSYLVRIDNKVAGIIEAGDIYNGDGTLDVSALELVWDLCNRMDERSTDFNWYGYWLWIRQEPLRSMMVGDTIEEVESGQVWVVASQGFVKQEDWNEERDNPMAFLMKQHGISF